MNIIDAIKSGKPFKRKSEFGTFYTLDDMEVKFCDSAIRASGYWLAADDFIIEEKTITISESQFDEAWGKFLQNTIGEGREATKDMLKKELGF